jgi:penicillin-binding protein 1A
MDEQMAQVQQAFEKDWAKRTKPWEREKVLKKYVDQLPAYRRLLAEGASPEAAWQALEQPREMFVFDWQAEKRERKVQFSSLDSLRHYFSLLRAGLLSVEPQTGLIRVWVGGIDHKYIQYDHVLAKRQVGSTFKPVVYAQALRNGAFPCEYIENKPVTLANYQDWSPRNSDGEYGGVYSMEGALSQSINTIAVELLMKGGIEETAELAEQLGIGGRVRRVPAIALGAVEASLQEMVTVYSAFANGGKRPELHYLDRIATADGNPLVEFERPRPRDFVPVLEPEAAAMVSRMLKTVVDSGTAQRLRYGFGLYGSIAGKTGTTQNQSDGWFLGYTPRLVTGVWVGAENPGIHFRTLYRGQGSSTALPVWGSYMKKVRADRNYRNLFYGNLNLPNDSLQQLMACPPYLPEMPLLADMWALYRENPGLFNQLFRSLQRADSSELQPLEFKPRRPFESQEAYFQRMANYNERLREREERRLKRKEFWSRLLFGESRSDKGTPEEQ